MPDRSPSQLNYPLLGLAHRCLIIGRGKKREQKDKKEKNKSKKKGNLLGYRQVSNVGPSASLLWWLRPLDFLSTQFTARLPAFFLQTSPIKFSITDTSQKVQFNRALSGRLTLRTNPWGSSMKPVQGCVRVLRSARNHLDDSLKRYLPPLSRIFSNKGSLSS